MYDHFDLSRSMPGMRRKDLLDRCGLADSGRLQRGVHAGRCRRRCRTTRRRRADAGVCVRFGSGWYGREFVCSSSCAAVLRRGVLPLLTQIRLAPADGEQLVRRRKRGHARRVVVPGRNQCPLDGTGSQPFHQQVGRHVVAGRNHLLRRVADRHLRARRQFLEAGRADRLWPRLVMVSWIGPAHRPRVDRLGNRKQHIEFEDRSQRQRQVGVGARDQLRTCRC